VLFGFRRRVLCRVHGLNRHTFRAG
jgi:hypothetical protein